MQNVSFYFCLLGFCPEFALLLCLAVCCLSIWGVKVRNTNLKDHMHKQHKPSAAECVTLMVILWLW